MDIPLQPGSRLFLSRRWGFTLKLAKYLPAKQVLAALPMLSSATIPQVTMGSPATILALQERERPL